MVLPGVGAMPKAMEHVRRLRPRRADARAGGRGRARDRGLHGDAAALRLHHRARRRRGHRADPGRRGRARRARAQGAADRVEPGRLAALHGSERGPAGPMRLLPRELVRAAPGGSRGRARHGRLRERVRERGGARARCTACSSIRRSPGPTGSGCSGTSCAAACQCPHDPAARGGHPRRQGGSPAAGTLRRRDRVRRHAAGGGALVRRGGRALPARGGPRRGAGGRAGEPRPPRADHPRAGGAGAVRRRPALARVGAGRARGGRRARGARHGRLQRPGAARPGARDVGRPRGGGGGRPRRPGVRGRLDQGDTDARRGRDRAPPAPRRVALRLHERGPRRHARRPRPRRGRAHLPGGARPLHLLRRHRIGRGPARRCARGGW